LVSGQGERRCTRMSLAATTLAEQFSRQRLTAWG
jgi:hypothetical protein